MSILGNVHLRVTFVCHPFVLKRRMLNFASTFISRIRDALDQIYDDVK